MQREVGDEPKSEKLDLAMCSMIKNLLSECLSPEQISGRLKLELGIELVMRPSIVISGLTRKEVEIYASI